MPRRGRMEEGVAIDVVYVGAMTHYHVTLDRGGVVQVVSQNLGTTSSEVQEGEGAASGSSGARMQKTVIDHNGREQ